MMFPELFYAYEVTTGSNSVGCNITENRIYMQQQETLKKLSKYRKQSIVYDISRMQIN